MIIIDDIRVRLFAKSEIGIAGPGVPDNSRKTSRKAGIAPPGRGLKIVGRGAGECLCRKDNIIRTIKICRASEARTGCITSIDRPERGSCKAESGAIIVRYSITRFVDLCLSVAVLIC